MNKLDDMLVAVRRRTDGWLITTPPVGQPAVDTYNGAETTGATWTTTNTVPQTIESVALTLTKSCLVLVAAHGSFKMSATAYTGIMEIYANAVEVGVNVVTANTDIGGFALIGYAALAAGAHTFYLKGSVSNALGTLSVYQRRLVAVALTL